MKNSKHIALFITCLLISLLLSGCIKTVFGVPEDQWQQLTPQQQSQVIAAYNQRQQTEAENAPIIAAIGAASTVLTNNKSSNPASYVPPPASYSTPAWQPPNINPPAFPSNMPMHGGCTTQGGVTNCNYSGSQSSHSTGFNTNIPKF